jgi:peroxiredoxin
LTASGVAPGLDVGDQAPEFALPDQLGRVVSLGEQLAHGPVVLVFYRGDWCPYCNGQLVSYARKYGEFQGRGAEVVGISVDSVEQNAAMVEKLLLPFPLLSDAEPDGEVIRRAGVFDEVGRIAKPSIFAVTHDGQVVFDYVGQDFIDRPGDEPLFDALDRAQTKSARGAA